jgi:hypothetical protein
MLNAPKLVIYIKHMCLIGAFLTIYITHRRSFVFGLENKKANAVFTPDWLLNKQ